MLNIYSSWNSRRKKKTNKLTVLVTKNLFAWVHIRQWFYCRPGLKMIVGSLHHKYALKPRMGSWFSICCYILLVPKLLEAFTQKKKNNNNNNNNNNHVRGCPVCKYFYFSISWVYLEESVIVIVFSIVCLGESFFSTNVIILMSMLLGVFHS